MVEVSDETFKQIQDEIRDTINWVKVFEGEYNLPAEVVQQLRERLENISGKLGQ